VATFPGWEQQVLQGIGAPSTSQNVGFLDLWQHYEGGTAANNPLNTTQPAAGATSYNSVGVKNYPSPAAGAAATSQTLLNGRYTAVVAALRSGDAFAVAYKNKSVGAQIGTWGTKAFGSLLQSGGGALAVSPSSNPVQSAVNTAGGVVSGVESVGGFLGKLTDPSYLLRGLQIVAGGVLVLVGLALLVRQVGLAVADTDIAKDVAGVAKSVPVVRGATAAGKTARGRPVGMVMLLPPAASR
jgi:hypothetical protein